MSDPKFEELDFLSQLTEPFETKKSLLINSLPDEVEVLPRHYKPNYSHKSISLDVYSLIRDMIRSVSKDEHIEWELTRLIRTKYQFKTEDDSENLIIDIKANKYPKIKLVKKDNHIDDKIAIADIKTMYDSMLMHINYARHDKIRNICEIFLDKNHEHYRQVVRQRRRINKHITEMCIKSFNNDDKLTSRFRSTEAMSNFVDLILRYVNDKAFYYKVCNELQRVKDLIDNGTPIYTVRSFDEVK